MSDDIIDVVDIMTLAENVFRLEEKVDMLRSEVDTIGNVLLQVLHGTLAITPAIQTEEEE